MSSSLTEAGRRTTPDHAHPLRADLQALRAFAVVAVVVYHVWPHALPGGFVGVDVFFVISGFLITGQLLAAPPARPREFARFWGRRVLRLIPAVALVLLATLGGAVLWMSIGEWKRTAGDAIGSMFYVENWRLIVESTNYLDQHRAPSPFQHFWSLSVEEQFYVGWPFVVGATAWVARRRAHARSHVVYGTAFGLVVAASLVTSAVLTHTNPQAAYFSTFTRLWELALGGLVAAVNKELLTRLSRGHRTALLWVGLAGLVLSVVVVHASTPYPGVAALLPTLAGAAVILAHDPEGRWTPRRLMRTTVVQHLGDTSYALYLWHWPLIILAPYALNRTPTFLDDIVVVALAVLAATASTWLLENPLRRLPALRLHTGRVFATGAALSLVVVGASVAVTHHVNGLILENRAQVFARLDSGDPCLGAGALRAHHCPAHPQLLTSPEFAKDDISPGIAPGSCLNYPPFPEKLAHCQAGDTRHPARRIALLGNSQAGQWYPTLSWVGHERHWQLTTYLLGGCTLVLDDISMPQPDGASNDQCRQLEQQQIDEIAAAHYDLVVVSSFIDLTDVSPSDYANTVQALSRTGTPVLILHTTPTPLSGQEPPDCVAQHLGDLNSCAGKASEWERTDALADEAAALKAPGVQVLDLNALFCPGSTCPSVIGGVIVYRDNVHMTATYARTISPFLSPYLKALMTHTAPPADGAGTLEPATTS